MSSPTDFDDIDLLAQFSRSMSSVMATYMDRVDMHRGQALVLCTVARKNGLTQSEIGDVLSVQGATVTNMLQKMEDAGWVIRRRDDEDNRLVRVFITEDGRGKERMINEQLSEIHKLLFDGLSEDEAESLRRLLAKLMNIMDKGESC